MATRKPPRRPRGAFGRFIEQRKLPTQPLYFVLKGEIRVATVKDGRLVNYRSLTDLLRDEVDRMDEA